MATEKAVKFAAALIAETGEKGAALAANATGGVPTTEHPWKVVATLIDNLLEVRKEIAAEAKAAKMVGVPPVGEGTGVVTGTVVTVKEKEGTYGPYTGVIAETAVGNRVWFIAPKGFTAEVGDTVAVEGEWKRADDDAHFAFGKKVKMAAPAFA